MSVTRPHFVQTICSLFAEPVMSSYSVAVLPRWRSVARKICASTKVFNELYTVPTDIRSASQARCSCSAVKGCGKAQARDRTMFRTLEGRLSCSCKKRTNFSWARIYARALLIMAHQMVLIYARWRLCILWSNWVKFAIFLVLVSRIFVVSRIWMPYWLMTGIWSWKKSALMPLSW